MFPTAGIGFKPQHFEEALAAPAEGLWFEVHAENYMVAGGPRTAMLEALRAVRPLSLHGVGLSLAGDADPDPLHLASLKRLVDRFEPFRVSEHLAWSRIGDVCFPDLLPFPRSHEALARIGANIQRTQDALRRTIAIENPSLYLDAGGHELDETDFLGELVRRTGCELLIDINNVHVSAHNLGFDPRRYLDAIPAEAVSEIHLAGHSQDPDLGAALLIDSHDAPVAEDVWALFSDFIDRIGRRPTLIERDGNVPPFEQLMSERERAAMTLERAEPVHA